MSVRDRFLMANSLLFRHPKSDQEWRYVMRELGRYTVGGNPGGVVSLSQAQVNLRASSAAPAVSVAIPGTAGLYSWQFSGVANLQLEFVLSLPADVLNNKFRLLFTLHWGPGALAAAAAPQAVQWKYEVATQTTGAAVGAGAELTATVSGNTTAVAEDYIVTNFGTPIDCSTLKQTVVGRLWRDGVADVCATAVWLWNLQATIYEVST